VGTSHVLVTSLVVINNTVYHDDPVDPHCCPYEIFSPTCQGQECGSASPLPIA